MRLSERRLASGGRMIDLETELTRTGRFAPSLRRSCRAALLWLPVIALSCVAVRGVGDDGTNSRLGVFGKPTPQIRLSEPERKWIEEHRTVRWGFDPNWPPFSSSDPYQRLIGIDIDLTRLVAKRAGLNLAPVLCPSWPDVYERATNGGVDVLSGIAKTPERMEQFVYTHSYGAFPVVIITRNEAPFLTMRPDLESLSIAVARDNVVTGQLKIDVPSARFVDADNAEQALKMVSHGDADATVQNLAVASRVIRLYGLTNLKISGVTHYEFPLRFAVRKDMPMLASILDKALASVSAGELESIYAAHLTPDIGKARDWAMWRRRAWYAGWGGLAVTALLFLWNRGLKHEVRRRRVAQTELEAAHEELAARNAELHARVAEIEKLGNQMRAANHDLESFTISVSHDLRGPLRRLSSFAELLLKEAGAFLSRRHSEWLGLVVKESKYMDEMIHDLLELARLGQREIHMQRINMNQLAKTVIEDVQPQVHGRRVMWQIQGLGVACGDPQLIRLVLANLIDNALKYTRHVEAAEITVGVIPEPSQVSHVTFFVQDNGCGFDMKETGKVFEPFERLPQAKGIEGLGIGLANVRTIVERHGGRVWCDGAPDRGATFYFTLLLPEAE